MKMPEAIDNIMLAPCGMNCMVCYVHLKKVKPCCGCLSESKYKPERCNHCKIKDCARNKGLVHCFECPEFPCQPIKNLEKSYLKRYQSSLLENSRLVKAAGLEVFFQKEKLRWTCQKCQGVISLHGKDCSECGIKISPIK
jgi:hypothetical protein